MTYMYLGYDLKTFLPGKKRLLMRTVFVLFWLTLKLIVPHDRPLRKKHVFRL